MLGTSGIGLSIVHINSDIEQYKEVNDGIRTVVSSNEEAEAAQSAVLDAANECRTTYEEMAMAVQNLSKASGKMFNPEEAAQYASVVTKLLKTAGRSEGVIAGVIEGLNKSFQKGEVDSETLNRLLETAPEAADTVAEYLGTTKNELLQMAVDGHMKVEDLKNAFLKSSDRIDAAFDNVGMSISDALKSIRNDWGLWISQMDQTLGVTNYIGRAIARLSNIIFRVATKAREQLQRVVKLIGGADKLMNLVAISASAVFVAMKGKQILTFLRNVNLSLTAVNVRLLAIVASVVAVFLIIEDLYHFVKGENSLTGLLLEKAGVDVEAFRTACKTVWDLLVELGTAFGNFASSVGGQFIKLIKGLLPILGKLGEAVLPILLVGMNVFAKVVGTILSVMQVFVPLLQTLADTILPVISALIDAILPLITTIAEAVLPVIVGLVEAIAPILQAIAGVMSSLVKALLPVFIKLIEALAPLLKPVLELFQGIADVLANIVGYVGELIAKGVDKLGSLFSGGAEGEAGRYKYAYADGTESSADTFLAGEHGPEIITGAAGKKVFTALETGDILRNLAAFGKMQAKPKSVVSNSNTSKVINQYNSFSSSFYGDRAGQKKSESAMTKASGIAVDEMARALAFAR